MDMYYDSSQAELFSDDGEEMTPYHRMIMVNDFSKILDEIASGNIPTNTGQPFPVDAISEFEECTNKPFGGAQNIFLNK